MKVITCVYAHVWVREHLVISEAFIEKTSLLHWIALLLCQRSIDYIRLPINIPGLFFPLNHLSLFSSIPLCLDHGSFAMSPEIRESQCSDFVFLFQYRFDYSGSLTSSYTLKNLTVNILKKSCWNFDWDHIKSIDKIGENWNLNIIETSCLYMWNFHLKKIFLVFFTRVLEFCSNRTYANFFRFLSKYLSFVLM